MVRETINLSQLKDLSYLVPGDLYDLAKLSTRVMNAANEHPNSTVSLTIHGLAGKYSYIVHSVKSEQVEEYLNKMGFKSGYSINDDEKC